MSCTAGDNDNLASHLAAGDAINGNGIKSHLSAAGEKDDAMVTGHLAGEGVDV